MIRALIVIGLFAVAQAQGNAGSLDDLIGNIFSNPGGPAPPAPGPPPNAVGNNRPPAPVTRPVQPVNLRPLPGFNVSVWCFLY